MQIYVFLLKNNNFIKKFDKNSSLFLSGGSFPLTGVLFECEFILITLSSTNYLMTIFGKIGLSKRYGKAIYAISAALTLAISSLVFFNPYAIPMGVLLKLVSIPIILYLYTTFTRNTEIYFYLNLGISRKEYYFIPFVVEFIGFILFITLIAYLGNAIR